MTPLLSITEIFVLVVSLVAITLYALLIAFYWRKFPKTETSISDGTCANQDLALTVIVAYKNEVKNITRLIAAFEQQTYANVEYILVNDHSTDNTEFILAKLLRSTSLKHRMITNDGKSKKQAIHTGVAVASSNHIVLTDADCIPAPNWLACMAMTVKATDAYLVIGCVTTSLTKDFLGKFQELDFLGLIAVTLGARSNPILCNGANLYFRKSAFEALQPFADNAHIPTGDDIFLLQAVKKHYPEKITFLTTVQSWVSTEVKPSWRSFFEQRIRWGAKTINYTDHYTLAIAILVACLPFALLSIFLVSLVHTQLLMLLAVSIFIKVTVDSLLLIKACKFFRKTYLIPLILPTVLMQLVYYPVVAVWGLIRNLRTFKK